MKTSLLSKVVLMTLLSTASWNELHAQATINVRVVSVAVTQNEDCDGFFTGDSDFVWEFIATDNTLGNSNNNPVLFGVLGDFNYAYQNGNNGPYTMTAPGGGFSPNSGLFFSHDFVCPTDVPSQITIDWRAYENDDILNYSLFFGSDGETNPQTVNMAVPVMAGTNTQTYTAASTDAGCPQVYQVTFEVENIPVVLDYLEDNICAANYLTLNTTYNLGWCPSVTLEPNEPAAADVASNGSAWFKFVAPAGGEVEITTDLSGTEFGTYIEIYHAADGGDCVNGIQPVTATVIKDKFDYLSHQEFSDGIDFLGVDPEAEITLDACDPLGPISYQKLLAGEVYYVQVTSDDPGERGYFQVRVNDLGGGSPANPEDIPCTAPFAAFGTSTISSGAGDPATINLDFGCAYDGGNDFGEVGVPHTSNDPNEYHAYDYDHPAAGNGTINESVWLRVTAPNSGRLVFETDYQSGFFSEDAAFFGYDKNFAPGTPADYSCADLENLDAVEGGLNGLLGGGVESAIITQQCLEPGYDYWGMVDPANGLTLLNSQNIDAWVYDPSVDDPINNPPGNDILCLTMVDPLYEIPVTPAGSTPPFQAVAGSNERACTEYLAGEPPANPNPLDRADQTVWHYFTVPPSGAIEMNIRAYIGMDTLRYAVYELLNGTDCYGGLNPATFTEDGTQATPIITPVLTGSAGFSGTQESICCMTPGNLYAIQLDGGSPGDEGQYIIEFIREVDSYSGDTYVELANLDTVDYTAVDIAFICFNDSYTPGNLPDGNGDPTLDIPSCLTPGFVLHDNTVIPDPVAGSGFTYIDTIQGVGGTLTNDTDGSGSFGNPLFNTVYYLSSMADEPATWGDFTCNSSTVDNAVPVVYLETINPISSYDNALCQITFTATGGMYAFDGSDFSYTIEDGSMNLVATGTFAGGTNVIYDVPSAEVFTISVNDGACPYTFTVDASACANPCIVSPINIFANETICEGDSIFLEGAYQNTSGLYTDIFVASNGCDSTVFTTLDILQPSIFEQTVAICQGGTFDAGGNTYNTAGVYIDTLVAANGCDSIITTNLFVESTLYASVFESICFGSNYDFNGTILTTSGTYSDTLSAAAGCDSVVTLNLVIEPQVTNSISATICTGDSYSHGTGVYSSSGEYTESFTTVDGCDSLVTLYLFVTPTIENNIGATICQGQTYTLGAQNLTTSGEYTELYTTATGCDSLVRVFLTVTDAIDTTIVEEICLGESYTLGTQTLTASGIYSEQLTNAAGCDSIVTLELTVLDCEALLEISNICTPNGDDKNDTWKVSDLNQIQGCTVQIFNRWGQLMFETNDYQNDWNGTKDGEVLPDGAYYYVISCTDEREYQGVINLLRLKK